MKNKTISVLFEIDKDIWNKFKDRTPRSITLQEAVVSLVKKEVERDESE